jgi:hypothetical protein
MAAAMAALHLAWQADYMERSLAHDGHTAGGKKSGATRRNKRDADLTAAAVALNRLIAKNDVKAYTLSDIEHYGGMPLARLRKLGLALIRARASTLRRK